MVVWVGPISFNAVTHRYEPFPRQIGVGILFHGCISGLNGKQAGSTTKNDHNHQINSRTSYVNFEETKLKSINFDHSKGGGGGG